ncbi:uracil transporter [Caloranaerobacter azorensis H53214]|uniref:Uracil transporter n=1 Tax=Caloranaerobacter azorensis H53214 TaxID=1156417 RepID=A0A096BK38_9FIRM|nr:solute carrier family 23 protein [Caloranaerobacter azorensis]KGG81103.1 uracil transporter [Caloranaerobacter azorensis H53214]
MFKSVSESKKEKERLRNLGRKGILGLQHVIAMFGATVLVPILTGLNPAVALFSAGVGTLIFHFVTKGKVPVFLGSSFAFIPVINAVANQYGDIRYAQGGIIVAGALYLVLSMLIYIYGADKIKSFFPPIVTGPMIIVIGLILSPVAIQMASKNWLVAFVVVFTVIGVSIFSKGFFKVIPILCGVVVGYIFSAIIGIVNFEPIANASLISVPQFTLPKFSIGAIAMIAPIVLAVFMEHIGDITTNGAVVGKNFFEDPGLHRTLLGDGLATMFAGFIGGPANTTYGENTSVLAVTRVYDPSILRLAAFIAVGLSFIGKLGAILQTIPEPVMGGVSLILFGMIASVGIRTITNAEVDFSSNRNLIISSLILVAGIGTEFLRSNPNFTGVIGIKITDNIQIVGLSLAALIGIIVNKILPETITEE